MLKKRTNGSVRYCQYTSTHSLYAWIKKYGPDSSTNKEQSDAQAEIRRLQKELKRVTDER
ncbi:transposase, partial [Escherichia coli]